MAVLISGAFLYCFNHRKERNLAPRVHENTPLWSQSLNFFKGGTATFPDLSPCGEVDTSSPHFTPLGALGVSTRLAPSVLDLAPPTSTPRSAYDCTGIKSFITCAPYSQFLLLFLFSLVYIPSFSLLFSLFFFFPLYFFLFFFSFCISLLLVRLVIRQIHNKSKSGVWAEQRLWLFKTQ